MPMNCILKCGYDDIFHVMCILLSLKLLTDDQRINNNLHIKCILQTNDPAHARTAGAGGYLLAFGQMMLSFHHSLSLFKRSGFWE